MRFILLSASIMLLFQSILITPAHSQSDFSFSLGGGAIYYNGDLHDNSFLLPKGELMNSYFNVDVSVMLVDRLHLSVGYLHGEIEGDDKLSINKYNKKRNLSFFSPIDEINFILRLKLNSLLSKEVINPYILAGGSYFWFKPQADLDGKTYELQPLGTEGQYIKGAGNPSPYKLSAGTFTFGLGAEFKINPLVAIRVEGAPHFTFTDYLDDVSTKYPNLTELEDTPNGDIAIQLSNRYVNGEPKTGAKRGNSTKNDVFITAGMSLIYTPPNDNRVFKRRHGILHKSTRGKSGWRR